MRKFLLIVLALVTPVTAEAVDRLVPSTYATINAALAAAGSGDVIKIAAGTYTECVVLPNKGNLASPIIIRADTADGNLPAANVRVIPGTHGGVMPILAAANTSCAVIKTAVGAQDYQIGPGLKLVGVPSGYRSMIELGANDSSQMLEADQPQDITIDRVWLVGDTWIGQKAGVDLNGKNLTVKNSYIEGIKGVSQDSTGVRCFNGTGPLTVYNNYISSAGYGFICGGDQPNMMTFAKVNAGATTTTATLSGFVDKNGGTHTIATLRVGYYVSMLAAGGTMRYHPKIISCGTSTAGAACSSNTVTYEAVPTVPDTGTASDIQWGAIPSDISIRRNYFWKDPAWMNNILATPVISSATPSTSAGSLPASTYYYKVQVTYVGYQGSRIYSTASSEVSATLSGTGQVTVSWGAITGPSSGKTYRVFRSTVSGTFAGYIDVGNVTSYVDTGVTLTGTSAPSGGTNWVMKNAMELKFANRVQIDSNIFKNSPVGAESGYAIWFKSNQYGPANYMHTRDVVFEKNVMDGMDGCFSILGRIDSAGSGFTRPLENLTIRNNICFDSNTNWMQGKATVYAIKIQSPVVGLTIDNNTFQHTMRGAMMLDKTTTTGSIPTVANFSFRNNIFRKETYGVFGESCTSGNFTECFTEFVTGTSPFIGNVVGVGSSVTMPTGNLSVPIAEYEGSTHFESYQHTGGVVANFALKTGSSWRGTANGGGDPGANIALLTAATTGVTTGALEGTGGGTPPNITTASPLTSVVEDSAMASQCIAATDGTTPYVWSIPSGSALPTGTTINSSSGCITGTPTTPGTYTFSVRVTDAAASPLTDTQSFQWTITPASATLTITTTTLDAVQIAQPISKQIVAVGGTQPYTFSATGLPSWLTISSSGLLEGIPTATGTFNITARVDDAAAANDTQALSQVVNAETQTCGRRDYFIINGIMVQRAAFRGPVEPSTSAPACARKDDTWFDTVTNTRKVAKQETPSSPLVWAVDTSDVGGGANPVLLDTASPPVADSLIIGTADGQWTITGVGSLSGIDAAAITRGTIDPDRLPLSATTPIPHTVTLRADATDHSMAATASFTEIDASGRFRVWLDLTNATEMMIHFMQTNAATTNPRVEAQYSLNNGSSWTTTNVSTTFSTTPNVYIPGTWMSIPPAARVPVLLRVGTIGGNGAESPDLTNIYVSVR